MKNTVAEQARRPVALGMKSHIGWSAVVALAGPVTSPEVVAKRRIDMATTFDEGAVYHKGRGKALPPLASILKSHALVHAAEGDLYRRVLLRASEACRIPALPIPEREIEARAAGAVGIRPARFAARLAALGKASGKPWTRDQKESAMVAWIALAAH